MKIESERTLVTLASGICLVGAVIKEIAGDDIADKLNGSALSDDTMSALVASEFNKSIIATRLPGA